MALQTLFPFALCRDLSCRQSRQNDRNRKIIRNKVKLGITKSPNGKWRQTLIVSFATFFRSYSLKRNCYPNLTLLSLSGRDIHSVEGLLTQGSKVTGEQDKKLLFVERRKFIFNVSLSTALVFSYFRGYFWDTIVIKIFYFQSTSDLLDFT